MPSDVTDVTVLDATGVHYRDLNEMIREAVDAGASEIELRGINGQRFICAGSTADVTVRVNGVPGNDLAVFMGGPTIVCNENVQDGAANTMNSGTVVIRGNAGDVLGYGMRGGKLFVRGDVGYRVGIHMKEFGEKIPAIVVGGRAGNFLAEYMAGGVMCILGLGTPEDQPVVGSYCGTGMHGGVLYVRQPLEDYQVGKEVGFAELDETDVATLTPLLEEFCQWFSIDRGEVLPLLESGRLTKLYPFSKRPYGNLYAY